MDPFGQVDIGSILNSNGSIVSCVLLRAVDFKTIHDKDHEVSCNMNTISSNIATNSPPSSSTSELKNLKSSESLSKPGSSLLSSVSGKISPSSVSDDINTKDDNNESGTNTSVTSGVNTLTPPASSTLSSGEQSSTKTSHTEYEFSHLVSQIQIDTTPKKREVEKVLGGPFTFIGQYEDLGVVVMALRDGEGESDENKKATSFPWNPHKLQPPLHDVRVRGDILMLKVNAIEDEEENQVTTTEMKNDENSLPSSTQNSENDFFLNFTRDEYLKFASRKDIPMITNTKNEENISSSDDAYDGLNVKIVETQNDEDEVYDSDDEDDEYLDNEEEDGDYEEEMDEEEERVAMMNLLMGQIIRRFRQENNRGPDTKELLEMRQALAMKLGVEVPDLPEEYETKSHEEDDNHEQHDNALNSKDSSEIDTKTAKLGQSEETNSDASYIDASKKRKATDAPDDTDADNEEGNCNMKRKRVRWSTCLEQNEKDNSNTEMKP